MLVRSTGLWLPQSPVIEDGRRPGDSKGFEGIRQSLPAPRIATTWTGGEPQDVPHQYGYHERRQVRAGTTGHAFIRSSEQQINADVQVEVEGCVSSNFQGVYTYLPVMLATSNKSGAVTVVTFARVPAQTRMIFGRPVPPSSSAPAWLFTRWSP